MINCKYFLNLGVQKLLCYYSKFIFQLPIGHFSVICDFKNKFQASGRKPPHPLHFATTAEVPVRLTVEGRYFDDLLMPTLTAADANLDQRLSTTPYSKILSSASSREPFWTANFGFSSYHSLQS